MAAPGAEMSDNSSSSDDEQLRRCQEAVWDSPAVKTKDASSNKKPSKRLVVSHHDHDGNRLQVTQDFQIHVAQKLGAMLDSFISEKPSTARPSVNPETTDNKDDEDEGFLLFSTSVPGQKFEEPPPPKRPIPSTSDSDSEMEMRLKEAAISIKDLLPASTSEPPTNSATPDAPSLETKEKIKKKRKKKKKPNPEVNGQQALKCTSDNPSKHTDQDDAAQTTVKRKKKSSTKGNSDALNNHCRS